MGAIMLLGAFVLLSLLFLVAAGLIGYGAETWAPEFSTLIFLACCVFALGAAWPLAVFVTRHWDTQK